MDLAFSWWLLLPVVLSALYGYVRVRADSILGLSPLRFWKNWAQTFLLSVMAVILWSAMGFSLPIFYILAYLCSLARFLSMRPGRMKQWFLLNLGAANTLTIHMIFIGVVALTNGSTMHAVLEDGFWRIVSVSAVLMISCLELLVFLRWPNLPALLAAEMESEEAKPFMAFLWFCTGYLLLDSMLCVFDLEPLYTPLFLIGGSVMSMFFLIRFLLHINALIQNNHLKEEHVRLASRLEAAQESADTLRRLTDLDALTGVFSRRYAMERVDALIEAETPFSLIFLDLDGLKQINDRQGHGAGDDYLIHFSRTLEARLRDEDFMARVGGDEFVVLMPRCDINTAAERIQDIRIALEQEWQEGGGFRFSFGITAFSQGKKHAEQLIREADLAMYRDKIQRHRREGRL